MTQSWTWTIISVLIVILIFCQLGRYKLLATGCQTSSLPPDTLERSLASMVDGSWACNTWSLGRISQRQRARESGPEWTRSLFKRSILAWLGAQFTMFFFCFCFFKVNIDFSFVFLAITRAVQICRVMQVRRLHESVLFDLPLWEKHGCTLDFKASIFFHWLLKMRESSLNVYHILLHAMVVFFTYWT